MRVDRCTQICRVSLSKRSSIRGYKDKTVGTPHAVRVSTYNVTTSRQIFVQLGQNIVPVEDNQTLQFTTISNDNARGARNYEVGKQLAPLC